jgi:hypothetical protein
MVDASLVIYINSTNIPPIMIIDRIYGHQNLLSLQFVSFLVGLRTYQQPCTLSVLLVSDFGDQRSWRMMLSEGRCEEVNSAFCASLC